MSPLVTRTLARARGHFREGLATYGEFHNLHHYLGFRVWQTELLRNEQARVVQGLYDSLAHTTNTSGGFETGVPPRHASPTARLTVGGMSREAWRSTG